MRRNRVIRKRGITHRQPVITMTLSQITIATDAIACSVDMFWLLYCVMNPEETRIK
ncbi:hypothetical protein [Chitinophaga sp. LS1]|uniref:hypothetical protein n=1 Tax=Chitinophaga sp. LS1 TaxID=3051176 RepID=UPI002AAC1A46|nr:hypothetical protein [Chitinophaga sp. LS1]WPV70687.1 hypothetical protein QQL36_22490 [Chitinophaga sp. LS1]